MSRLIASGKSSTRSEDIASTNDADAQYEVLQIRELTGLEIAAVV